MRRIFPVVLLLAVASCATNPVTGRRELSLLSESQEIDAGRQGAQDAIRQMGLYADSSMAAYVASLGMPMARRSERPDLPWSFSVVDDPAVNAFALPGGPIFVTRGILAHMNSEAQLVSVVGHEIGHVTAKHSVHQMSRAQLAQIGLGVAMVAKPEWQKFGDLGGQFAGLVFMKFGRDDETQADGLGFKYMTAGGYDPSEMTEMFRTLDRVSGGSARSPEWLSTHPNPENRVQKTQERIAAWGQSTAGRKVNRDEFLRRLDGLVFGDDPRNGYFQQTTYLHPTLKFRFDFPAQWKTQNQAEQVVGVSAQQDALIVVSVPSGIRTPSQGLQQFLGQQGMQTLGSNSNGINGLPAATGQFLAQGQNGTIAGYASFIQLDGTVFRVLAYTDDTKARNYDGVLRGAIGSFQRLTDPRALAVKPARVRVIQLRSAMTLAQFNQQFPSVIPIEQLALINGVDNASVSFPAGRLVKRVVIE